MLTEELTELSGLFVRPTFARGGPGTLTVDVNGFKYSSSERRSQSLEIKCADIKHAFFQPAENEMITLIHFHLHNPITVGNKKTKDVQFYVEVMDRKNSINMEFHVFVNKVNSIEFDQPVREHGFQYGIPFKTSSFVFPTSACLVELVEKEKENPFLVITLSEIEIVNLERVGLGKNHFDMTIVFKDLDRDVIRIDSIPCSSLDGIKKWLEAAGLKYYQNKMNLAWRPILKTISNDRDQFIEEGGWEFLNVVESDPDSEDIKEV